MITYWFEENSATTRSYPNLVTATIHIWYVPQEIEPRLSTGVSGACGEILAQVIKFSFHFGWSS